MKTVFGLMEQLKQDHIEEIPSFEYYTASRNGTRPFIAGVGAQKFEIPKKSIQQKLYGEEGIYRKSPDYVS